MSAPPLTPDLLDLLPAGICLYDRREHLTFANPAWLMAMGVGEDAIGLPRAEIMRGQPGFMPTPGVVGRADATLPRRRGRDGMLYLVQTVALPDGGTAEMLIDATSTSRFGAEAELAARNFHAALAALPDGVALLGADNRLIFANPRLGELLGLLPPGPEPGISFATLQERIALRTDPADDAILNPDARAISEQLRHDSAGRLLRLRLVPLAAGGFLLTIAPAATDGLAEARLAALLRLGDRLDQGLALWGSDGALLAANATASRLLAAAADMAAFAPLLATVQARQPAASGDLDIEAPLPDGRILAAAAEPVASTLPAATRGGAGTKAPAIGGHLAGSGTKTAGAVANAGTATNGGHVTGPVTSGGPVTGTVTNNGHVTAWADVTELRNPPADNAAVNLLAGMDGMLRHPLEQLSGLAGALRLEATNHAPPARLADYAQTIAGAALDLAGLLETLLDLARIQTGRFVLAEEEIDTAGLIVGAVAQATPEAEQAGLSLSWEMPPLVPWMRGDRRVLTQVLTHLLVNGVKFTPPGGAVRVDAGVREDGALAVRVADTGPGMSAATLAGIFDPTTRLERRHPGRGTSSGLGLTLCRALMGAMGGALQLDSVPDQGTTATLVIPARLLLPRT